MASSLADPVAVLPRYIAIKGDNGMYGLLTFDAAEMTRLATHEVLYNDVDDPNATFIIRSQNMRFWRRDSANWIRADRDADQPPSVGDTAARFTLARVASGKLAFRSAVDSLYLNYRYNRDLNGYNACLQASVTIICSTAKMRIPFTYKSKDTATDGTERPSQEFVDGIFEGVDAYNIEAVISDSVKSYVVPVVI